MARPMSEQPTEGELQILNVLWELGCGTARQVHEQLSAERDTNYSTTVKMLKIMLDKGWIKRDDSVRPQVFKPVMSRTTTGMRLIRELANQVYKGSMMSMAMQAISSGYATEDELRKMRELLDQMEARNHGK